MRIVLTGIGQANARTAIQRALDCCAPAQVISSGFAGGLNPSLAAGDIVFDADERFALTPALIKAGARSGRFTCAQEILATASAKQRLWQTTGADAVEMESEVIRSICHEHNLPSATVRVISDCSTEDLPIDFNLCLTAGRRLNYAALAWVVLRSPSRIRSLLRFNRQTRSAAERLAQVLGQALPRFTARGMSAPS